MINIPFFSDLYSKIEEFNITSGIIIFALVTLVFHIINPLAGFFFYGDLDFLFGAIVGMLIMFKARKKDQDTFMIGIKGGIIGGILSTALISVYYWIISIILNGFNLSIFFNFGFFIIIGIGIGFLVGALLGLYYKNKPIRKKVYTEKDDDFFKDLIED